MVNRALGAAMAATLAVAAACSSTAAAPPGAGNGVNDVKAACRIRMGWTRTSTERCLDCMVAAPLPRCDCEQFREFGGLCQSQEDARHSETGCTAAVNDCTNACRQNDCTCIDACYGQAARCEQLAGARDGCVVDACGDVCR
jgi:hypothetical protein